MIEERGHGVKRKLSDVEGDLQTRCYQRQTIFDISICKLRKNYCSGEPMLSKTVLIANTIRLIEEDIEEEKERIKLDDEPCSNHLTGSLGARMIGSHNSSLLQNRSREILNKPLDFIHFEEEINLLGDKMVRELGLDCCKDNYERRQRITSENTDVVVTDSNNNASSGEKAIDSEREIVSCSSLLGLELTDELEFGDIDLSLYDFDTCNGTGLPVEVGELCAAWGLSTPLTARCGDSIKRERPNENFDELDQVMQILVGS